MTDSPSSFARSGLTLISIGVGVDQVGLLAFLGLGLSKTRVTLWP